MCLFNCQGKNKKIIYANVYRNTINDGDSQTSPLPIFPEGVGTSVHRLFMNEDDVTRLGGRVSMAPISADAKNPMILPKNHHVATILIRYLYEVNGHCGVEQVLSLLREQFWVVKA